MLRKIIINLLFLEYLCALTISGEQIGKLKESLEKRKYLLDKTEIKHETIHFAIKTPEGIMLTTECKPTHSIEFDCIYKKCKDFRSKHEFVSILRNLSHFNHLQIYDVYECYGFLCIIREYFKGGVSIKDSKLFKENENDREKLLINLLKPIFYVLDYFLYLRHKSLYHGSISLDNILINEKGEVKICELFSIKKSYFCEIPKDNDVFLISRDENIKNTFYGEDLDVKNFYELIMKLLNHCDIDTFINEKLKIFMKDFKAYINIWEGNLINFRNHCVFDDVFNYNIFDFRELDNFFRVENNVSLQKTDKNNLVYIEKDEYGLFVFNIKIKSTYTSEPSLINKVHDEFLEVLCYKNQEQVVTPSIFLKIALENVSEKLFTLKDTNSYIAFTHMEEINAIYNRKSGTFIYCNDDCIIMRINNVFRVQLNDSVEILTSISAEENYNYKTFLILLTIFKGLNYNCEEFKLECETMHKKFIEYQEEVPYEEDFLPYKQLVYKLKLPFTFIDGIGSVEINDENYVYRLENEFEHEIYEMESQFYKISLRTLGAESVELTEAQMLKIQCLKAKILASSHFRLNFSDKF